MLGICKKIFDEFMEEGISYCHWKSNEHLMEGLKGQTDLDLLVFKAHADKIYRILTKCECIKVCPQFGSRYEDVEEWLGFDRETGKLIHLHVHFKMVTGTKHLKEYILPWHDLALSTRILQGNVYVMEPNLEFIILYMRIVLKESKLIKELDTFVVSSEYRKEIQWLRKQIDYEMISGLLRKIWREATPDILEIYCKNQLTKNDWANLQTYARDKAEVVRRGKLFSNHNVSIVRRQLVGTKNSLRTFFDNVPFTTRKTLQNQGCVFVFIGCDGSGKSTVTEEIYKWLSWKMDCQRFYFGTGEGYKKPVLYRISMMSCLPDTLRKICQMLFFYRVSLRCVYMRRLIDFYVRRGGIAICDRYPQTQFQGIYDGPKIQNMQLCDHVGFKGLLANMEVKNIAKVESKDIDGMFKLILSAETAVRRSPGHSRGEVKRKAEITEKLVFPQCDVYRIDATKPYATEILEIKGIIWDKLIQGQS